MTLKSLFAAGLTHLKRVFGGYKKYGISEIAEFSDLVRIPKKITRGSIRNLAKLENKIRAIGEASVREYRRQEELERKIGTRDAKLFLDNLKTTLEVYMMDANSKAGHDAMTASFRLVWDMVERSIKEKGATRTVLNLTDYAANLESELSRLIQAVYDEEYRNKRYLEGRGMWRQSLSGVNAYKAEISKLSAALEIPYSGKLMAAMKGNLI